MCKTLKRSEILKIFVLSTNFFLFLNLLVEGETKTYNRILKFYKVYECY